MRVRLKDYTVEIVDEFNYRLNSSDNIVPYDVEYFDGIINTDRFYTMAKYGITITQNGDKLASAIICELGAPTNIRDSSFVLTEDSILICCTDKIYSLSIPKLRLNWKKRLDPATCFAIHPFKGDYIIHGELQITRIDKEGNEKWTFGARDIFVTPNGEDSLQLQTDKIKLRDWEGYEYLLNEDGQEIR